MSAKNNGESRDEAIRNAFTAYFQLAITRHKRQYEEKLKKIQSHESLYEPIKLNEIGGSVCDLEETIDDTRAAQVNRILERLISNNLLLASVLKLPERDRQLILLRTIMQFPFATVARKMEMSEDAAKKAHSRALQRIRADLGVDWV